MRVKIFKPGEPRGDRARHLDSEALERGIAALRDPARAGTREAGRVTLVVRRLEDGTREMLEQTRLTLAEGVPGDDWSRRPPRDPEAQLAVMCTPLALLIANGQPLTTFGDNLFVELDLSSDNLPTGTWIAVGTAEVEVTPKPHDGCAKFHVRFGNDALRFVQAPATRPENRRGIYWKVVREGEVSPGDPIRVLSRPRSA
jgi:hypothetical protein